jgi:hypothetical protein
MGHDVWRSNRRGPRRLGQRPRAQRAGRPAAVVHNGWSLTVVCQRAHGDRVPQPLCATASDPLRQKTALKIIEQTLCATASDPLRQKTALKIIEINRKKYC